MAKRKTVYIIKPGWYCVRRSGKDANGRKRNITLTICNQTIFKGEYIVTKRPEDVKMCGMCKGILNSFPGRVKTKLAKRRKK